MLWLCGLAGAFIYGGPKWVIALSGAADKKTCIICTLELIVALAVGSLSAWLFGPSVSGVVLTTLHWTGDNAICGLIGLFANKVAPAVVEKGSGALIDRLLSTLKGPEK